MFVNGKSYKSFFFLFLFFTFWVLDNVLQVVASQYAVGNEDVIVH